MNEEMHVIFAVDIAELAVAVCRVFRLVYNHSILRVEVPEAVFVGTLDLHLEGDEEMYGKAKKIVVEDTREMSREDEIGKGKKRRWNVK